MSERPVVVLDLDGVIIKSNFVKHRAMLAMFGDFPDKIAAVDAYILNNGGVARRDKLVEILEIIIGVDATEKRLTRYLARYAKGLEASLAVAPLVEGVQEFIARGGSPFYVSSTAPGLMHYFAKVYASHTPKANALAEILVAHPGEEVVFFGDSLGDLDAARATGATFVGVTNERDNFKGLGIATLDHFRLSEAVAGAIRAATRLRESAAP